ncbi:MAG: membrane protein [Paracoccaceae bacterium]|nr:MAG: NfeD family protein [Alphaproteobacteria bacterium]GIX12565.1 MAG: membrane protein [Paracoccaceae bacterium]
MSFGLFTALDGISPWWWAAAAIALLAAEMVVTGFVLAWPGLGALAAAAGLWIDPQLSGDMQVTLFALVTILSAFAGRWALARWGEDAGEAPLLNRRAGRLVGRTATVIAAAPDGGLRVEIDGVPWKARPEGARPPPGATVRVIAAEGAVLVVTPEPG